MHFVKVIGLLVGCIAGMVIVKQLNLPWFVTAIFIAVCLVGVIYGLASLNVDSKKNDSPKEGNPSSDKT
jgi:hypothetical protein